MNTMRTKNLSLSLLAGVALVLAMLPAATASAHPGHGKRHHGRIKVVGPHFGVTVKVRPAYPRVVVHRGPRIPLAPRLILSGPCHGPRVETHVVTQRDRRVARRLARRTDLRAATALDWRRAGYTWWEIANHFRIPHHTMGVALR